MTELVSDATEMTIKVLGERWDKIPEHLFIPPDALKVILQQFEGPLDLLLYLIRRRNIDILNIPMVEITDQYLQYIHGSMQVGIELAAEYLLMAALLIEIKTRLLLPQSIDETETEEDDPRAVLIKRLLQYELIKHGAFYLDKLERVGRDFFWVYLPLPSQSVREKPKLSAAALIQAWLAIEKRAHRRQHHQVIEAKFTVREGMVYILDRLHTTKNGFYFDELWEDKIDREFYVVTFIALLELIKNAKITLEQKQPLGRIYLKAA